MLSYKSTLFLATLHIQLTIHYFEFESKKLYGNRCRSNNPPKITENVLKMKARYKAKAM